MGKRKGSLGKTPGLDFLTVIALIAAAIVALFPVLWGLSTALKTDRAFSGFLRVFFGRNKTLEKGRKLQTERFYSQNRSVALSLLFLKRTNRIFI